MTLNDALILSYIKRGIGYGYKILSHVKENRSDEWVDFSRAGLYKTLDKLEKKKYVQKKLEQTSGRPPKKVYAITPLGETSLAQFLEDGFDFAYPSKHSFDAYLVTAFAASPSASFLAETVGRRLEAVKRQIAELRSDWPKDKDSYPFVVYALYRHREESLKSEYEWLTWLENKLSSVSGDVLHQTWGDVR